MQARDLARGEQDSIRDVQIQAKYKTPARGSLPPIPHHSEHSSGSESGSFRGSCSILGLHISRDAAWEEDGAFSDQYHRHSRCDAGCCLYVGGREQSADDGPWQLLLCSSCGSQGTHRRCSSLGATRGPWECEDCAEPAGAASHQLSAPGRPATSQAACGTRGRRPGPTTPREPDFPVPASEDPSLPRSLALLPTGKEETTQRS
ncbi:PHD finger protein 7-like isoform X2 [Mauremys reevesii]|uniref:PHD finger protein 7-like isoform X2 n=1 Tax=Mauremys reevesii TaxID=260615 RepID=UPI00193F148D|nr:PHD finger protein 7-like isoform X2 [Mauremys reevesii]